MKILQEVAHEAAWPMSWTPGPRANPDDPIQRAVFLVHVRLEALREYPGRSGEWDVLLAVSRALHQAVDARDLEEPAELAPFAGAPA